MCWALGRVWVMGLELSPVRENALCERVAGWLVGMLPRAVLMNRYRHEAKAMSGTATGGGSMPPKTPIPNCCRNKGFLNFIFLEKCAA